MRRVLGLVGGLVLLWGAPVWADTAVLTWTANTEADLAGYTVYQSDVSGTPGVAIITLGKVTTYTVTLPSKATAWWYYFTLTAYDLAGNESGRSTEVSKLIPATVVPPPVDVPPAPPSNLKVTELTLDSILVVASSGVCQSMKTTGRGLNRIVTCVH